MTSDIRETPIQIEKEGAIIIDVNDITIYTLSAQVEEVCKKIELFEGLKVNPEQYRAVFQLLASEYSLDKEEDVYSPQIIVDSSHPSFGPFLAFALSLIDVNKIPALLRHQKKKFKGNLYAVKSNFVGLVEYRVYQQVEGLSKVETTRRLEKIMKWVNHEREKKEEKEEDLLNKKLSWTGKPFELNKISEFCYDGGYTPERTSFTKVFSGETCHWMRDPAFLAYLLHVLYTQKKLKVLGSKAYLKIATVQFNDYSNKQTKKISFKHLHYDVQTRYREKYEITRKIVNELLKFDEAQAIVKRIKHSPTTIL